MLGKRASRTLVREVASAVLLALAASVVLLSTLRNSQQETSHELTVAGPVLLRVDAAREAQGPHEQASVVLLGDAAGRGEAPWHGWVWLDGPRLEVETEGNAVRTVAARIPYGVAIAVYNPTESPLPLRLSVTLPGGRYVAERLVFSDGGRRLERLQCARGHSEKPGMLPPASGAVYRFTNPMARASAAYKRCMQRIFELRSARADQARKLAASLRECPWNLTRGSAALARSDPREALSYIHRALLTVRHAQALCSNGVGLRRIPRRSGEQIAAELDELEAALGEASVTALDLVPSATRQHSPEDAPNVWRVCVTVRNAGTESIAAIRLWATGSSDCKIEPVDAAVFDVLRPGQAASATFKATVEADGPCDLAGHLAYVRKNAPAHVRLPCF